LPGSAQKRQRKARTGAADKPTGILCRIRGTRKLQWVVIREKPVAGSKTKSASRSELRRGRVAAQLRANLLKRKEQARARAAISASDAAGRREKPDR